MEYAPPPLFKQGASARLKVIVFALIAITLLAVDSRLNILSPIRQVVGVVLYPLQMAALAPRDAAYAVNDYFYTLSSVQRESESLRRTHLTNAQALQERTLLAAENAHLRQLLAAAERVPVKSLMAELLYDTRDPFTRKVVLDRGEQHGVKVGQPAIDNQGVVGQITRVFPLTAEVTLLTDRAQAIPVQVVRSGLRSVAYGRGQSNLLDLRFVPANADIRKGDVLVTSGIDGVYPAGLTVATVAQVESQSSDAFARIVCQPVAGIDRNRQILVLLPEQKLLPLPPVEVDKEKGRNTKKRMSTGKEATPTVALPAPAPSNAPTSPATPAAMPVAVPQTQKVPG